MLLHCVQQVVLLPHTTKTVQMPFALMFVTLVSLWFDRSDEQEVASDVCAALPASFLCLLFNIVLKKQPGWEIRQVGREKITSF